MRARDLLWNAYAPPVLLMMGEWTLAADSNGRPAA
jgi:hypothetical protein